MKVKNYSFRDIDHHYFLYPISTLDDAPPIFRELPEIELANALLLYGYIHHLEGCSFHVLGAASYTPQKIHFFPGDKSLCINFRSKYISNHELISLKKFDSSLYQYEINMINKGEDSETIKYLRSIHELDQFRDHNYPDSVLVSFYRGDYTLYSHKVLYEDIEDNKIIGMLLEKPMFNLGLQQFDEVKFQLIKHNNNNYTLECHL